MSSGKKPSFWQQVREEIENSVLGDIYRTTQDQICENRERQLSAIETHQENRKCQDEGSTSRSLNHPIEQSQVTEAETQDQSRRCQGEGSTSRSLNHPIENNPYQDDLCRCSWDLGWNEQHVRMCYIKGDMDRALGKVESESPYQDEPGRLAWEKGWIKRHEQLSHSEGQAARVTGKEKGNPYKDNLGRLAWDRGWLEADQRMMETEGQRLHEHSQQQREKDVKLKQEPTPSTSELSRPDKDIAADIFQTRHEMARKMTELFKCPTCNGVVSKTARTCPHCGERDFSAFIYDGIAECDKCSRSGKVPTKWEYQEFPVFGYLFPTKKVEVDWALCDKCNGKGNYKCYYSADLRTGESFRSDKHSISEIKDRRIVAEEEIDKLHIANLMGSECSISTGGLSGSSRQPTRKTGSPLNSEQSGQDGSSASVKKPEIIKYKQIERRWRDADKLTREEKVWLVSHKNPACAFHEIVGNPAAVEQAELIAFQAIGRCNHRASDLNVAWIGPPGTGKPMFGRAIGKVLDLPFIELDGEAIKSQQDIFDEMQRVLSKATDAQGRSLKLVLEADGGYFAPSCIVFIHEVHRLGTMAQTLLRATDPSTHTLEFKDVRMDTRAIMWQFATTDRGRSLDALVSRFIKIELEARDKDEIGRIVHIHNRDIPASACRQIAEHYPLKIQEALNAAKLVRIEKTMKGRTWELAVAAVRIREGR